MEALAMNEIRYCKLIHSTSNLSVDSFRNPWKVTVQVWQASICFAKEYKTLKPTYEPIFTSSSFFVILRSQASIFELSGGKGCAEADLSPSTNSVFFSSHYLSNNFKYP